MKRAGLLLVALALGACGGGPDQAERAGDTAAPAGDDGRVVTLPVAGDPTVSFSVSFGVGSEDDPPGLEGLAYLTGRLIADGATERNSLKDIIEALYPLAAAYDVRVDKETSTLTGRSHRDTVERYIELFTDAYLHPAFLPDDFERIRRDTANFLAKELRYASDEELGKATLQQTIFSGTAYAHPVQGTVEGLERITLDDVRSFYARHYTRDNVTVGIGGGFDGALSERLISSLDGLPAGKAPPAPRIEPEPIDGIEVVLVDKPGADASISFGFPLSVERGDRDFYALWIANSWLGEHRNSASHLFQVIRDKRGLNYGDYSYIESFPEAGARNMPPVNVARHHQIFEVWIRTLPNERAHFALRAALGELASLIHNGLSPKQFELTTEFLNKYSVHYADSTAARLGYRIDDRFYGIGGDGHLAKFRRMMDELTVDDVNAAIRRHLRDENLKIAIVTGDAEGLAAALASDAPSPIRYATPPGDEVLAEDVSIASYPLGIDADGIVVVPVDDLFRRH